MEACLAWAKRIEAQRAQAAVSNMITESRQFDKVKIAKKSKEDNTRGPLDPTSQQLPCQYCGRLHILRQCPAYGKMCAGCGKTGHFKKVCHSRRDQAVNELELEASQGHSKGENDTVSIDSVHLNKNWSLIMAELET